MSQIRCVYHGVAPDFPPSDQHPDAMRYSTTVDGVSYVVDAIGGKPTAADMRAVLNPPAPTTLQVLTAAGLTPDDLKAVLGI